jgi:excisionase family DNA binding protein
MFRSCSMEWKKRQRRFDLSRSVLYELIRSGQLRTVKQGRRRLVPVTALAEYVASLESGVT